MASSFEDRIADKELKHKTKTIQFFGHTTPIILQNDNGPCPLLAICNVLLLKNILNLSPDVAEISQKRLLLLVAERLIDSNSHVDNKDAGYVEKQQQNIAGAIDLLPRLTTGIDVNINFKGITEFEFTRESAIFDLLDIPLYHGWIVDPQDRDTYNAIGSKSYNAIMGDLVALETETVGDEYKTKPEEDFVDFVAATTATLGMPSPSLSRGLSFNDSTLSVSKHNKARKGDLEEEAELLRAMKISEAEALASTKAVSPDSSDEQNVSTNLNESTHSTRSESVGPVETTEGDVGVEVQTSCQQEPSMSSCSKDLENINYDQMIPERHNCLTSEYQQEIPNSKLTCEDTGECSEKKDVVVKTSSDFLDLQEAAVSDSRKPDPLSTSASSVEYSEGTNQAQDQSVLKLNMKEEDEESAPETSHVAFSAIGAELETSGDSTRYRDVLEAVTPSGEAIEPIYAGEECILEPGTTYEDREPVYEGEVVLAEQVDKNRKDASDVTYKTEISPQQGELIKDFLKANASQLTVYGLICLREELKERELCVFFRNNHFNTMFKLGGQLYLLATDQGYINQPDLVWEKLDEVNGNTVFMTGSFKEFKAEEDHVISTWNELNARASTADYLASIDDPVPDEYLPDEYCYNSDMELARALQEQEFEQQPQHNPQKQTVSGGSELITGPQVGSSDMELARALQEQEFEQQPQHNPQKQTVSGGSELITGPQSSGSSDKYLPQPTKPVTKSSKDKCDLM
ncbi:uncharacterized protein LOC108207969 [Daucus carota subsp. sativus]|uniref:uncharacterized protein LOC108207969 n=1 Tax=Daucus carota subsp. sativus TaxID=79200 RepID=UPI003082CA22